MPISIAKWNSLSSIEKNEVVNFLRGNCKIDHEAPSDSPQQNGTYPINTGVTSGGYLNKYGEEYRIYIRNLTNCPPYLYGECKQAFPPYAARIGGNDAIKAIMRYGNLHIGDN